MKPTGLFEFKCPECGLGTVQTTRALNYKTKIRGYPFVVDEALIGICDHCRAESFAPQETKAWEERFSRSLEARKAVMAPAEMKELRTALSLSMEDFARLIGCTRQSVSAWERPDRVSPPSRMADLLMKLLRASLESGSVDALRFLADEARKWGVTIEVRQRGSYPRKADPLIFKPRSASPAGSTQHPKDRALAAQGGQSLTSQVEVETPEGDAVGTLDYDYETGALVLHVARPLLSSRLFDAEIETIDGRSIRSLAAVVGEDQVVLQEHSPLREKHIARIALSPHVESPG